MRAPHLQAAGTAFECAVDELAYKLGRDPVDLRLANDTKIDPKTGRLVFGDHDVVGWNE
jgi:xanthine dehydrogenase YagR molybdenum-binding subunit